MTSRDFAYWLQGFFEIDNPKSIDENKTEMIKRHLNLVFKHEIDPSMGDADHQKELDDIHNKPTLEQLGEKHDFEVSRHGPCPFPGYVLSTFHGWYDPKQGVPRC